MSLNPMYVTAPNLMQQFIDKDTGLPLAGGLVYFWSDVNRTTPKAVYELQGNSPNYTYAALPNPIVLSAYGTVVDNSGNNAVIYYLPYNDAGDEELYYITWTDSLSVPQSSQGGWPNPNNGAAPDVQEVAYNFVPNGQFLAHTNLPNNLCGQGSTVIAQGGFTIELDPTALSTNTLTFETFGVSNIDSNPRFAAVLTAESAFFSENLKAYRIKWYDVNTFCANTNTANNNFTFGFWARCNTTVNADIYIYKYFGTTGSSHFEMFIGSKIVTSTGTFFTLNVNFPNNNSFTIDTVNNNDFIAIDIRLPTDLTFTFELTDVAMVAGNNAMTNTLGVANYPLQTNEDMIARGVAGWLDVPDPTGIDLYLPAILTRKGMTYDLSQVGDIGMSVTPIGDPNSTSPIYQNNKMPCNGATYPFANYSGNGIPYSRLGNYLLTANTSGTTLPLYGTGANFMTAVADTDTASNAAFCLSYNSPGAASSIAVDGSTATGFTINTGVTFGGSFGTASIGYAAYTNSSANVLAVLLSGTSTFVAASSVAAVGSVFTFSVSDPFTGLTAQGNYSFIVTAQTGAALNVSGGASPYFQFGNATTAYFIWFNVLDGLVQTPPTPGGTEIKVNILAEYTAAQVAEAMREAINGFSSSLIRNELVSHLPPIGSFINFTADPASPTSYFFWYQDSASPVSQPAGSGIPIMIDIHGFTTAAQVINATIKAINQYQYASPDFRGMFFRSADLTGIWDLDVANRWSPVAGVAGAMAGTFEYDQFLSHVHTQNDATAYQFGSNLQGGTNRNGFSITPVENTNNTGGSETRPVNTYIFPYIRY